MDWRPVYRITLSLLAVAALAGALWVLVAPAPSRGVEITRPDAAAGDAAAAPSSAGDAASRPVNINAASADELVALPGIGPVLAARIVDHRKENGPFARIDQIMTVHGIGPKTYENLRPLITVGN